VGPDSETSFMRKLRRDHESPATEAPGLTMTSSPSGASILDLTNSGAMG
jgi:hypothetical protein